MKVTAWSYKFLGFRIHLHLLKYLLFMLFLLHSLQHGEFGVYLSYPGQELKGPLDHLCDGKWLHSTPRFCHKMACKKGRSNVHVTVEKVD